MGRDSSERRVREEGPILIRRLVQVFIRLVSSGLGERAASRRPDRPDSDGNR